MRHNNFVQFLEVVFYNFHKVLIYHLNRSQSLYLGCLLCLDRKEEFDQKYLELSKKSICPDQFVVKIGLLVRLNSKRGRPNPSPLVRQVIAFTLGWLYN